MGLLFKRFVKPKRVNRCRDCGEVKLGAWCQPCWDHRDDRAKAAPQPTSRTELAPTTDIA